MVIHVSRMAAECPYCHPRIVQRRSGDMGAVDFDRTFPPVDVEIELQRAYRFDGITQAQNGPGIVARGTLVMPQYLSHRIVLGAPPMGHLQKNIVVRLRSTGAETGVRLYLRCPDVVMPTENHHLCLPTTERIKLTVTTFTCAASRHPLGGTAFVQVALFFFTDRYSTSAYRRQGCL